MPLEIVICGGGIAGASCALALSKAGHSVTLLEKDSRKDVGALRRGETLRSEVTKALSALRLMPYFEKANALIRRGEVRELWVEKIGRAGAFHYDYLAPEYPVIHASHQTIVNAVYEGLEDAGSSKIVTEAHVLGVGPFKDGKRQVNYKSAKDDSKHESIADLVIVADGAASRLRNTLWMQATHHDYGIGYLMFYLKPSAALDWGRFVLGEKGFVGVFPTGTGAIRAAVEVAVSDLKDWLTLAKEKQMGLLLQRAPFLKGSEIIEAGSFYHAISRHANSYVQDGVCLIGDAAHTTHPMLAQGISMVFNDIDWLRQILALNRSNVLIKQTLSEYEAGARPFNSRVMENSHLLFTAFQEIMNDRKNLERWVPSFQKMGFEK